MKKHEPNYYLEKPLGFEQFERLVDKLKKESPVKVN